MIEFDSKQLKKLYLPPTDSHKGQNGKLLLIGGSHLFHASTLWALEIASKIVDMVFYASVPENNEIVQKSKELFHNGIVIAQTKIEEYIQEADAVLIGPGMVRSEKNKMPNAQSAMANIKDILSLDDEGKQTYFLTKYLLQKYPEKKWIIDAGALQMLDLVDLEKVGEHAVITPHLQEFERVFGVEATEENVAKIAKKYKCIIVRKGEEDIICKGQECVRISGGNAGMTKGGTGDVLAGLIAAFACKNDLYVSATAGAYINKKAGEKLFTKVGYYFNATDLVNEIPGVMKELLI